MARISFKKTNDDGRNQLREYNGELRVSLSQLLRQTIRPEFLNRIDEIILFKPLLKSELKQIIGIQLQKVGKMLEEKISDLRLMRTRSILFFNMVMMQPTARPLKRMIQKFIVNPLSTELLTNKYESGDIIIVSYPGGVNLSSTKDRSYQKTDIHGIDDKTRYF